MTDPHEAGILLALVRGRWDDAEQAVGQRQPDPRRFVDLCRTCDVHPWVHRELVRHGREDLLGDEIAHELRALRHKVRQDNLLLIGRGEQALRALVQAGVTPLALKGFDLIHRLYEFDERTLDDIDLLVHRGDLPLALEVLEADGWKVPPEPKRTQYVRSSHHLPMQSPGPCPVDFEIHWNLAQQERFAVDPEDLFRRAVPLEVSGIPILRMCDDDLAAHLLLHHFSHYFDSRLKWTVDLVRISSTGGLDWSTVAGRMHEWRAAAPSSFSIVHLRKVVPDLIPESAFRRLPRSMWRRMLTFPLLSDHPLELFRGTRSRRTQLYLAAVMLDRPTLLPGWLLHRAIRDRRESDNPLDTVPSSSSDGDSS